MKPPAAKPSAGSRRILISAYACEPHKGSEPEAGWHWALQLSTRHDVTVITRTNNRANIVAELANAPQPHPHFLYYDLPGFILAFKRRSLIPLPVYYVLWQAGIRWRLRRELSSFDLIHHLTFNAFRWPGFWWKCKVPVLLGPLGGGQTCPWNFLGLFGRRLPAELLRSLVVLSSRFNPIHHLNCRVAARLIIANEDTEKRIPRACHHKIRRMLDAGIAGEMMPLPRAPESARTGKRLVWAGRLEKRKAALLALRAFARAHQADPDLRLTLVGTGPEASRLQRTAASLGLGEAIVWTGSLPRAALQKLFTEQDIFLFTSLRDTSGYVVLEAMAAGLPVVTLCHQGAAEMTTDGTALRVVPTRVEETTRRLAESILTLARSPKLRQTLGEAGRERVAAVYLWEKKALQMQAIYDEIWERG